ncbi:MAG: acyl-CoA synthetase [Deltaproteobacteria bacterium]|nr:acyl-CoA synthetase [Deltaproteobacteria bacterium]
MDSYQIADLFEAVADAVPDRIAIVCDGRRITYRELDVRASRLAHYFASRGLGAGDHIGTYLYNGIEYVTAMIAAFKISAVPINVNYRYVEDELTYLFTNADLRAVVHHREFAPRITAIRGACPKLDLVLHVEDDSGAATVAGSTEFEAACNEGSSARDFTGRSNDDLFIIYTGGTTGMPKGVMWPHEAAYFACFGGGNPTGEDIDELEPLIERARVIGGIATALVAAPLIHGAAQLATMIFLIGGMTIVYQKQFDGEDAVRLFAEEKVLTVSIVGDAMARPIADALERNAASAEPHDCSSVLVIGSAGAIFSEPVKDKLKKYLPQAEMLDNYGSTETGFQGKGGGGHKSFGQGLTFEMNTRTLVVDDDLKAVEAGSGVVGRVALTGHVPAGYYGDAAKSAETFPTIDGLRYSITGDLAEVEADGTIKLYGRGSLCINTGGEKVFVEEVENALKAHPAVKDSVVVGLDDERWGQRVVALVSLTEGTGLPDEAALREHCRAHIAGYKVPKEINVIPEVFRGPNGKADYKLSARTAGELSKARSA